MESGSTIAEAESGVTARGRRGGNPEKSPDCTGNPESQRIASLLSYGSAARSGGPGVSVAENPHNHHFPVMGAWQKFDSSFFRAKKYQKVFSASGAYWIAI